mmetsp:Transcript_32122/g.44536  ORF Transcript_32122/g.44536 Transcript_32122/m.44536 type:complete len:327 (+) Transcript_32122:294-1274(+)|eukprot:CAMPEP_0196590668 /NCGR_PEP_ID=MMETSP1081-20130531/67198_1 /TAXON_ID=36882 /ORGANISM="Pyramimonas amylifera, Strain CCMP720" /LENGTH=326 /DNA_ID=CAMNT_0041913823 /DNA_START=209 /DNA_END=1189 /DNA_ORIENTATION=+
MFGAHQFFGGIPGGRFESRYRCYSVACIDKPQLEHGDKVILPPSALDRLASLNIDYPMMFEIFNDEDGRKSHCGVLEFVAEEGVMYMPHWMQQNLLLQEGDLVRVRSAALAKGTYVKLRPHTKDFLDISNPKAVLETSLRNYSCMTVGDSFMVSYNNKKYFIDVIEAKPNNAISIIETDCEVDFAPPLDYVEPTPPPPQAPAPETPLAAPFRTGSSNSLKGAVEEEVSPSPPKFLPFVGSGQRLDGKSSNQSSSSSLSGLAAVSTPTSTSQPDAPTTSSTAGKVVFGGLRKPGDPIKPKKKGGKPPPPPPEEPKFLPFQGQGNKLK